MKRLLFKLSIAFVLLCVAAAQVAPAQKKTQGQKPAAKPATAKPKATTAPKGDDALKAELDEMVKLAPSERVKRLEEFVKSNQLPEPIAQLAQALLTSARAALGDERLRAGDRAAGVELFRKAVEGAPEPMPNKLFIEVVAQLPGNL